MFRLIITSALLIFAGLSAIVGCPAPAQSSPQTQTRPNIHLHWGARPGVTRYRLQVATDRDFHDIVLDRIIAGTETDLNELAPGKYFWRIAALTSTLGEFSSAAVIDTAASQVVAEKAATNLPEPKQSVVPQITTSKSILTVGGWRAAVGDVARPVVAHLRATDSFEVVGTNTSGVTFALDSNSGVELWSTRAARLGNGTVPSVIAPVIFRNQMGLDDVLVFDGAVAVKIEGKSGREMWRTTLPAAPSSATAGADARGAVIAIVDNSMRGLVMLNGTSGQTISRFSLPSRVAGPPAASLEPNGQFFLAYESGDLELRDESGTVIRSGSAASPATTGPIVVKARRDEVIKRQDMILIDTRAGLTGITAGDLKPLGRVTSSQELSRGNLVAADLDGDGTSEILMTTQDGYLLAIRGEDGKMMWDTNMKEMPQGMAVADLDGDGVLDVIITTPDAFAIALSGRDGKPIWRDSEPAASVANHASAGPVRGVVAVPTRSGTLVIASDTSHTGLRAIEFPKPVRR